MTDFSDLQWTEILCHGVCLGTIILFYPLILPLWLLGLLLKQLFCICCQRYCCGEQKTGTEGTNITETGIGNENAIKLDDMATTSNAASGSRFDRNSDNFENIKLGDHVVF